MTRIAPIVLSLLCTVVVAACGGNGGSGDDGDDSPIDANGTGPNDAWEIDAEGTGTDAGQGGCTPGADSPECNNCVDDDGDGQVDGADIECTGAIDDDESSFETGIPGDNQDEINQDCFFDGDSGAGNDRCNRHVCCILGYTTQECVAAYGNSQSSFDPADDCPPPSDDCIARCDALVPPGCDCFGCCTLCDEQGCVDVSINPTTAPDCDADVLHDPNLCPVCEKTEECGTTCEPEGCILCPGQDPSELPDDCEMPECPEGQTVCETNDQCSSIEFCSFGCCVSIVQ